MISIFSIIIIVISIIVVKKIIRILGTSCVQLSSVGAAGVSLKFGVSEQAGEAHSRCECKPNQKPSGKKGAPSLQLRIPDRHSQNSCLENISSFLPVLLPPQQAHFTMVWGKRSKLRFGKAYDRGEKNG